VNAAARYDLLMRHAEHLRRFEEIAAQLRTPRATDPPQQPTQNVGRECVTLPHAAQSS
jgi:hypothetical protein